MTENERSSAPSPTNGNGRFPQMELYPSVASRWTALAINGSIFGVSGALAWASYFSGDRHNTIYFVLGAVALFFLFRLAREVRRYFRQVPEATIDTDGVRLYYPGALFWPWPRIKGARLANGSVIVELRSSGAIDQGVWNRTEVNLPAAILGHDAAQIINTVERGVRLFGGAAPKP